VDRVPDRVAAGLAVAVSDSRWSAQLTVVADCPVCGRPLPPIVVDVDAWLGHRVVLQLSARAQDLDGHWWTAARGGHPQCIDPTAGTRL
jgi:hypothetical protein